MEVYWLFCFRLAMAEVWSEALKVAGSHPRAHEKYIQYGTAGFRTKAELLDHVMYRMGLLAVLRSRVKGGAAIGVMITASHNPGPDNGVKLVDPAGEMLEQEWEGLATSLANCPDEALAAELETLCSQLKVSSTGPSLVVLGRDTRLSSPALASAVTHGVAAAGGECRDLGLVTTPQLHYMVVCLNTNGGYGTPTLAGYYHKLSTAFKSFMALVGDKGKYKNKVVFDGANGVGAVAMAEFQPLLAGVLDVSQVNTGDGELNSGCGADHVKVSQGAPTGLTLDRGVRHVSVDGDSDRVVYYYQEDVFRLLDGDRIATLLAGHIQHLVKSAGLDKDIKLGLVQTAYANGSSTAYIRDKLGVPVSCVPTGVKHLHHEALKFDIGVYFEANGHGTVVFSDRAVEVIKERGGPKLATLVDVINQTVGDAISDMLAVECVLADKGWDVEDWASCYQDMPNILAKVMVRDRNLVTTRDAERQVVTPAGMQDNINKIVGRYNQARSFVRPSGTEDCVRVYSEAQTREEAEAVSKEISDMVRQMIG